MDIHPILFVGGSGVIGRQTARYLRDAHPDLPILIGGRDAAKAQKVATTLGKSAGVALDLTDENLGLSDSPVGAVATFLKDDHVAGLRFALARGVPHLSISSGVPEMGPEVAAFIQKPTAAPVVLGTEWLVGATTVPALAFATAFGRIDTVAIGALNDEQDTIGPAADEDMKRLTKAMPAALTRRAGAYVWRVGDDAKASFRAIDGVEIQATAFATNDVLGLAAETGAPNVSFDLATDVTSSRRRGQPASTEIIIELIGTDHGGQPLHTRHAVFHPEGQVPLTSLGVAMLIERLTGLDGQPATPAGLYFPYQLLDTETYLARLKRIGGQVLTLDTVPTGEVA